MHNWFQKKTSILKRKATGCKCDLLGQIENEQDEKNNNIITGHESWIFEYNSETKGQSENIVHQTCYFLKKKQK